MLQTLNIPSSPLPEVPGAQPGPPGDAGERAEFAQLLQQASANDGEAEPAAPASTATQHAKDARAELRERTDTPRHPAHDAARGKPHDVRKASAAIDNAEAGAEAADLAACMKHKPLNDAPPVAIDTVSPPKAPDDDVTSTGDTVIPVPMHASVPAPTLPTLPTAAVTADERSPGARLNVRIGGRDVRGPATRLEASGAAASDAGAARTPTAADAAAAGAKDAAIDLATRQAATIGRGMAAPSFERLPLESAPAAAQAIAFARELQQHPLAARTGSVTEATLHAAPDEAGFAPALGAQVALWVKDGVQEARLQLHPAELGPVTVQIALDGQAAHVDFTAVVAATRESIEQSLPALAAALRESGFTLAGGGVFGRSGQGANDGGRERAPQGRSPGERGTAAIGTGDAGAQLPRRWARSLVDVYA